MALTLSDLLGSALQCLSHGIREGPALTQGMGQEVLTKSQWPQPGPAEGVMKLPYKTDPP